MIHRSVDDDTGELALFQPPVHVGSVLAQTLGEVLDTQNIGQVLEQWSILRLIAGKSVEKYFSGILVQLSCL